MNSTSALPPYKVVLAGFGMVAAGNADDPIMGKSYRYSCHMQAIRDHPSFELSAVVDPSEAARELAKVRWGIKHVFDCPENLPEELIGDVLVLAVPPAARQSWFPYLNRFNAIVAEKPLGSIEKDTQRFAEVCRMLGKPVQIHFWRRFVSAFQTLKGGQLEELIGEPAHVQIVYGNGLRNNGIHLLDFLRWLFGEVVSIYVLDSAKWKSSFPLEGDRNLSVFMKTAVGLPVYLYPVDFANYRENAIIIGGATGELAILNDCRVIRYIPSRPNKGLSANRELAYDEAQFLNCDYDTALYGLYDNLGEALEWGSDLGASLDDALKSEALVDQIFDLANM